MYTGEKISTFQERFSELVSESKKTITELAKELHVSNQTISAWRIGTRSPKQPTIIAIADCFGIKIEWLMGFDVEKNRGNMGDITVILGNDDLRKVIRELSPEDYIVVTEIFDRTYKRMKKEGRI